MGIEWNSATDSKVVCIDKSILRQRHYEQSIVDHDRMSLPAFIGWLVYLAVMVGYPIYLLTK